MKATNLKNEEGRCSRLFVCAFTFGEWLLAIISCAQVTVNNDPTQHSSDSSSDGGGGREIEAHFCKSILQLSNFLVQCCAGCEINQCYIRWKKVRRDTDDSYLSANGILTHLSFSAAIYLMCPMWHFPWFLY